MRNRVNKLTQIAQGVVALCAIFGCWIIASILEAVF